MADEDDQWLYGNSNPEPPGTEGTLPGLEPPKEPPINEDANGTSEEPAPPGEEDALPPDEEMEEGRGEGAEENGKAEAEGEGGEEEGEDEEDSDEDNVNVVIGDISKAAPTYTNLNVHKRGGLVPAAKGLEGKFSMEEFESAGVINGVSAVEYNIEILEDKPWRKPGADITDYFNYGFNEDTWKAYCDRQKRIRVNESCVGLPSNIGMGGASHPTVINTMQQNTTAPKRAYESTGQIHVVGGNIASRRHDQTEQPPPMHLPPLGMPPPGFPAMQPPFQQPPPFFPPGPGPDYSDNYDPQWRPDSWQPNNLITPGTNMPPPKRADGFQENFERFPPDRERENENDRHREDRDRDRDREREDRDRERDHERDRDRDREREERDREREREREERDRRDRHRRSRSRSHGRERSRVRSRSRSPSHKKHKKKSKKSDKSDKKKRGSDDSE